MMRSDTNGPEQRFEAYIDEAAPVEHVIHASATCLYGALVMLEGEYRSTQISQGVLTEVALEFLAGIAADADHATACAYADTMIRALQAFKRGDA